MDRPRNWTALLEEKIAEREMDAVRTSVKRGRPFGSPGWVAETAGRLGLDFTLRPGGRPKTSVGGVIRNGPLARPLSIAELQANSPCINAGNNAAIPDGISTDDGGYSRIVDGTVDIGAFEYQ